MPKLQNQCLAKNFKMVFVFSGWEAQNLLLKGHSHTLNSSSGYPTVALDLPVKYLQKPFHLGCITTLLFSAGNVDLSLGVLDGIPVSLQHAEAWYYPVLSCTRFPWFFPRTQTIQVTSSFAGTAPFLWLHKIYNIFLRKQRYIDPYGSIKGIQSIRAEKL